MQNKSGFVYQTHFKCSQLYPSYLTATSLVWMPTSELSIFAVAIAIERRFLAPLNINSTPPYTLFVGVSIFFNIFISLSINDYAYILSFGLVDKKL